MKPHQTTDIIHPSTHIPERFAALTPSIHHASTVLFDNVAALRKSDWRDKSNYTYGLQGTPTTRTLEAKLAAIEGGQYCLLAPSGLAAITLVSLSFVKTGESILIPENSYLPNRELAAWLSEQYNITLIVYPPTVGENITQFIQPNTRLIWTESPGSVSMEVSDISLITKIAKEKGILVAIDNTWSAGLAFKPFSHGVDISIQSLTKYQSGGSDVLMGAVITPYAEHYARLDMTNRVLGMGVGMDDVYLVLRSLPSLPIRFATHDAHARYIAAWLKKRPEVSKVLHPALPDCPGHAIWQRDFTGAGGVFSIIFDPRYTEEQTNRFVDSLKLFKIGYSWGGAHSLCIPYQMKHMRSHWTEVGQLVRLNIGLEDVADLVADLEAALSALAG